MIDLNWIRRLIDMVDESGIDSLEISRFGTRVRIAKSPSVTVSAGAAPIAVPATPMVPDSAATLGPEEARWPYHLAYVRAELGDPAGAERAFRQFLRTAGPEYEEAIRYVEKLLGGPR